MKRLFIIKSILTGFAGFALAAVIMRFARGLGFTTGLNDYAPWGYWNGLKIAMVALAGGGFTLAGIVHVFHLYQFKPVLKTTVLTAFLGYSTFIIFLMLDIGLPWNIWHPLVYGQHYSFLFEIGWMMV